MTTVPDGVEVVATSAEAAELPMPPFLIIENLTEYFDREGLSIGELSWRRIGEGHSNVTYAIRRGNTRFVLRRGPRPPHPPTTHDMVREAGLLLKLGRAGVLVPTVVSTCTDDSVIGVPFYVMNFIDGVVITDSLPSYLAPVELRETIAIAAANSLAHLHLIDVSTGELSNVGRPEGYLLRQVDRFGSLWSINSTREIRSVERIQSWLRDNLPISQATTVVHGDFRIGNLMYALDSPARVVAILDWEMATLGDPLADLGYLTATYAQEGVTRTPLELTPVTRLEGFPSRDDLIAEYHSTNPLDMTALPWYQTLALWKAAIFCEALYSRWLDGERPEDKGFLPSLQEGVPLLLSQAAEFSGITGVGNA